MSTFEIFPERNREENREEELADLLLDSGRLTEFQIAAIRRFRQGLLLVSGEENAPDILSDAIQTIEDAAKRDAARELYRKIFSSF